MIEEREYGRWYVKSADHLIYRNDNCQQARLTYFSARNERRMKGDDGAKRYKTQILGGLLSVLVPL